MSKKNQSERLTKQQKENLGVIGIFCDEAKKFDVRTGSLQLEAKKNLEEEYPQLKFRYRKSISKREINKALNDLDKELGQSLFLEDSKIIPDGGIIEVKDDSGEWRIILISEAKHQGKDIENIEKGIKVGKKKDQDLMEAGNAIERSHKNIAEIANLMLKEIYFPYILFLEGSNFLTHDIEVRRPNGEIIKLKYNSGVINRLDRLTAANYGMPLNKNLCENKFIDCHDHFIMLQAASIYTTGNGKPWNPNDMLAIMIEIAKTSLKVLAKDLFNQLTKK